MKYEVTKQEHDYAVIDTETGDVVDRGNNLFLICWVCERMNGEN